jgi:hypothetical protein
MPLVHTVFREQPFEMGDEEAGALRTARLLRDPPVPTGLAEAISEPPPPGPPDGGGSPDDDPPPDPPAKAKATKEPAE